ncbi:MAG: hypothetical protein N3B18_03680 [Desulfobacterota bacterium]|nr:hypothetical protein [Thermodesulfobacteriota bacterium]
MAKAKQKITCCHGKYHVLMDETFYCMAPPNIQCAQLRKGAGKFTKGKKTIFYCTHFQHPCTGCAVLHEMLKR